MARCLLGLAMVLCACHARIGGSAGDDSPDANTDGSQLVDASPDASMLGPWSAPSKVPGANTAQAEDDATLSADTLELYYAVVEVGTKHLWWMKRSSPQAAWGLPARMLINSAAAASTDDTPRLSADGLTLYFESARGGNNGDIYKSTRATITAPWQTPTALAEVNSAANDKWFMPCGTSGHYMIVSSRGGPSSDFYEGTLGGGPPTAVAELNSAQNETGTFLTQDCLTIMFASARSGNTLLYQSHRTSTTTPWQTPTLITDFVTGADQQDPWMAADGRTFVFASNPGNNYDIYISTR
jgi:hypothetical protein